MKKSIAIMLSILFIIAFMLPASAFSSIAVKGIKLDKSKISLKVGQTYKLKVTFTPANTTQKSLSFVTANKNSATVDKTGNIKAIKAGSTTITVYTYNKKYSAKCNVSVTSAAYAPTKNLDLVVWNTQGTDVVAFEKPKQDIPGDWLAKKTKVKIKDFFGNGGQQWEAKLTTLVASGNLPNLVLTQAGQGPTHHAKLHEGDLNWELTPEMIQKYAPDVWKFIPQFIWDSIKVDGKIYGIPFSLQISKEIDPTLSDEFMNAFANSKDKITSSGDYKNCLAVRDDILKKLIPSAKNYNELKALVDKKKGPMGDEYVLPIDSTEKYIKFMYDIKNLGLKEGDKPVYAFGYNGGDNWMALCVLGAEMYGYKHYYYTTYFNTTTKKMEMGYLNPLFMQAAKTQNQMINDKVIDPESLVHNAEKFKEKVMNGQYAIINPGYASTNIDSMNIELEKAGKAYRYIPFFTQVPQNAGMPAFIEGPPTFKQTLSILKTVKKEDVPQVLNWINTMFTDEWEDIRHWGTKEAGLYTVLPDGTRKFKDEKMQKMLCEGDMTAMDWKDAKGLVLNNNPFSGGSPAIGYWQGVCKWIGALGDTSIYRPEYFNKTMKITTVRFAAKFPASSKWVQNLTKVPNMQIWSAEYANIEKVAKFWSSRSIWDDPFKIALTAKNETEFDQKWNNAVDNLKKQGVQEMLDEMTKVAVPLYEKRAKQK